MPNIAKKERTCNLKITNLFKRVRLSLFLEYLNGSISIHKVMIYYFQLRLKHRVGQRDFYLGAYIVYIESCILGRKSHVITDKWFHCPKMFRLIYTKLHRFTFQNLPFSVWVPWDSIGRRRCICGRSWAPAPPGGSCSPCSLGSCCKRSNPCDGVRHPRWALPSCEWSGR